ncbi:hypothetical protein [Alteromonas gilva]|uniref:Lipoprotein n=1 Tax=Alteromonas gilva TaxID=2987522 RepID=A0ABT5L3C2_9ALTE|nr:hypothetical protein [Alteromonas gilva]MDC8831362.1 hypothetical protein [Alteromonas gilva]
MIKVKRMKVLPLTTVITALILIASCSSKLSEIKTSEQVKLAACLQMHQTFVNIIQEGKLGGFNSSISIKARKPIIFQSVHNKGGYRGICSEAQFELLQGELVETIPKQMFVFVQSFDSDASEFNEYESLLYSLNKPKNFKKWFYGQHQN